MFAVNLFSFVGDLLNAHHFDNGLGFLFGLIFLFGGAALGLLIIPRSVARPSLRALAGYPLLFIIAGSISILIYALGLSPLSSGVIYVLAALLSIACLFYREKKFSFPRSREVLIFAGFVLIGYVFMYFGWGETKDGTIKAISGSWGDGVLHTLNAEAFKQRSGGDFSMPAFAGELFKEPFGYDFVSGVLLRVGFTIGGSFTLPASLLMACLLAWVANLTTRLGVFIGLSKRISRSAGAVAATLTVLGSGLQWVVMATSSASWSFGKFFGVHSPVWDKVENIGLIWANHVNTFSSQKHFLLATSFMVILAAVFSYYLERKIGRRDSTVLLVFAVTSSSLAFFHAHAFIAVSLMWLCFWLIKKSKKIFVFGVLIAVIALPIFLSYMGAIGRSGFIKITIGYMAPVGLFSWAIFWFVNLGLFLPIAILALANDNFGNKRRFLFGFPAVTMFFLGNLIQFQPYLWDNHKIFLFSWFMLLPIVVVQLFAWFATLKRNYGIAVPVILVGAIVVTMVLTTVSETASYFSFRNNYPLYTPGERKEAKILEQLLPTDAVVLAATDEYHKHPITLTGRNLVLGYGGWIWSRGMDLAGRVKAIDVALAAPDKKSACEAFSKLKATHVVVDSTARTQWSKKLSPVVSGLLGADEQFKSGVIDLRQVCR